MKHYSYYFIDLDEIIYADSGEECEAIYNQTHEEEYKGDILVTNLITEESQMMYHVEM